jgi:hypothetical protein
MQVVFLAGSGSFFRTCKENKEEDGGDEDIHPDGVQVADPFARNIFPREETGPDDEVFYGDEELAVEVRDIFEEMADQMPDTFFGLSVFLPAVGAIPFFNNSSAIQAGLIMTEMVSAHDFFFNIENMLYVPD